jgi:predicted nicotinamide N-methyase
MPPTSFLPPLKQLCSISATQLSFALGCLRSLYFPPAPPPLPKKIAIPKRSALILSNQNGVSSVPDSGYASATDEQEDMDDDVIEVWECPESDEVEETDTEMLRADDFERAFVIKWLTGFIARCDMWIESVEEDEKEDDIDGIVVEVGGETETGLTTKWEFDRRTKLMEDATTILSLFSSDQDENNLSANVTRSFSFPTRVNHQINIELNDEPMSNQDHTSVGLQSWASSILLAERIASSPSTFLPPLSSFNNAGPIRILELGAGTGLLSILTAKIFQNESTTGKPIASTIIATDYHPDVLENLERNVYLNFANTLPFLLPSSSAKLDSSLPIVVNYLDWANPPSGTPLDARFDVILAADVIYHPDHARWIRNCVERYLRLPTESGGGGGIFWLMIAVRTTGRHEGLDITVDECFHEGVGDEPRLVILEKEEVDKQGSYGRADEGGYRLFKIGWSNRL